MKKKIKEFNKVTAGFVTQKFKLIKEKYVCVFQAFTASDMVAFEETKHGEEITPTAKMQNSYQSYEMVQPPNESQNL